MEIKEYEKAVIGNEKSASMGDFWKACKRKWKWFVCSIVCCCLLALLFILMVNPKYERSASVLIKDESSSGGMLSSLVSNMGMLSSMAGINISSNVNNEMEIFRSPALMEEATPNIDGRIQRTGLDDQHSSLYCGRVGADITVIIDMIMLCRRL